MRRGFALIRTGIDRLDSGSTALPRTARFGLLTNRAARTSDDRWTGSTLLDLGYRVLLLLTPEHGLTLDAAAGAPVDHSQYGDIPVLSLYGADSAPIEEAMEGVDALIVDLPDVGCRYYTYGWTVREVLKLAALYGKPVYCLDRPNPLDGVTIEGSIPQPQYDSAVCASSVPVRHGLTLGELALWHRRALELQVDISVVTAEGWRRPMDQFDTDMPWVPPSPALRTPEAAMLYGGTCLIEGTNVSEGRGTDEAFVTVGAPFVDGAWLADALRRNDLWAGVSAEPIVFTPRSSKWAGQRCEGVRFTVVDRHHFRPVRAGIALVATLMTYQDFAFLSRHFDALAGTRSWRDQLVGGAPASEIAAGWQRDEASFRLERESVLQY